MKKIILSAFIAALFINSYAYAGKIDLDFSEIKPVNASVRSAFMPGWGQSWNKQPVKAWATFGIFAASTIGALYFNSNAFYKYDKYEQSGIRDEKYYDEYEDNYNVSKILTFVAIGTWLYSVIDAYFVCKKQIEEEPPLISFFNFSYDGENNAYYLKYTKKFDI
ncbi:MAG: DUF5683 domain-containing protein [Endomicrobium sp.]|jgi:hypothetical protein|nr:DUF5683 domain-containing protein [Endomicrobium sp.]